MPANTKDILSATLVGVVVGGVIGALLDIVSFQLSNVVGAFAGGAIAAYVLYGQVHEAARAGVLSGIFGMPFYLGVGEVLYILGAIPPQTTTPTPSQLQFAVGLLLLTNLAAGAFGSMLIAAIRHPAPEKPSLQPATPGATPEQLRYCVQCGAQLPAGAVVCPHCNARQPS